MTGQRPDRLRLRVRAGVTAGTVAAALVFLVLLGVEPAVERVAALAVLGLLVAVLVWEVLPDRSVVWELARHDPVRPAGQDAGTASWVRLLEAHRSMRRPDDALQLRLRGTVEDLVQVRHGTSLAALDATSRRALLGEDLDRLVHGPPTRVTTAALLSHIDRIEDL